MTIRNEYKQLKQENDLIFSTLADCDRDTITGIINTISNSRGINYEVELVRKDLIAMAASAEAGGQFLPAVIGDVDAFKRGLLASMPQPKLVDYMLDSLVWLCLFGLAVSLTHLLLWGPWDCYYDAAMLAKFDEIVASRHLPWRLEDLLPKVLTAGEKAGELTPEGAKRLDGLLAPGIPFAPAEGDAGTGMTATNAVAPRTGNVSAGTSIFSMVVLEKPLEKVYQEIDLVTTPTGRPVAMVHCNNCTNDTNAWVSVLGETARLFGAAPSTGELYTRLYEKSLEGDPDCGWLLVCNYMAGEGVTHMDAGRPLVIRKPESKFTLANFFRAQLYSTMSTLKIGMDILAKEHVAIDSLTGHGGLFKTPVVGQKYMAAACGAPVTCMETAGEGGPYGMALLAAYMLEKAEGETLEDYLNTRVFAGAKGVTLAPEKADVEGFHDYITRYTAMLDVERKAVEVL